MKIHNLQCRTDLASGTRCTNHQRVPKKRVQKEGGGKRNRENGRTLGGAKEKESVFFVWGGRSPDKEKEGQAFVERETPMTGAGVKKGRKIFKKK